MMLSSRASAFTAPSPIATMTRATTSRPASRRGACVTPRARLDSGVGAFGSKAGMTQVFTEDGLCVPVTVIAVREGNIVTQVRWVLFFSHPGRRVVSNVSNGRARVSMFAGRVAALAVGGDVHRRIVTNRTRDDERRRARAMRDDETIYLYILRACARAFAPTS